MMKLLANRKIKSLFAGILSCIMVFILVSAALVIFAVGNAVYYIISCGVCMGIVILLLCYGYFKEQHKIMELAITQITEYISGNKDITIDGKDIFSMDDRKLTIFRRRNIGFIFQAFNLIPELTVEQNIIFPVLLDYQKPDKKYLEELLTVLNLKERRNHLPSQLSGGQQQRVAIGRALITRPSLILADEPTGNLDTQNSSEVIALLKEASKKYEQTIIMITHNRSIALTADRVFQVSDGVLADLGRCRE